MTGLNDLRYSLRLLAKRPRFTALTVLVLAGGLAVSLYTYNVLNTMVYRALPIPDGGSVVQVVGMRDGGTVFSLDAYELATLRSDVRSLSEIGVYRISQSRLGDQTSSRAVNTANTEWNVFEFSRTQPSIGRGFVQTDHRDDAERVAVIGHELWQAAFAADPEVVGRVIPVNGQPTRVIGVMPEGYAFPISQQLWLPLTARELDPPDHAQVPLAAYARLAPGYSSGSAEAELTALLRGIRQEAGSDGSDTFDSAFLASFQLMFMWPDGPAFFAVLNIVSLFILLLACVNVGNLLLARTSERIKEISVRVALGAPRFRLMLQMLLENGIICIAGTALALLLVSWTLDITNVAAHSFVARLDGWLPYWWNWALDGQTIAAAVLFATVTLLLVSILPILGAARADPQTLLRDGTHGARGPTAGPVSRALVAVQIALMAAVMLAGGALASVAYRMTLVDYGMDTTALYRMLVAPPDHRYDSPERRLTFYERLHDAMRGDAEIEATVLAQELGQTAFAIDGREYHSEADYPRAARVAISEDPGALLMRLVDGRGFDDRDRGEGVDALIVSESVASTWWPDGSAIGSRVRVQGSGGSWTERVVVGVAAEVARGDPFRADWSSLYVPLAQAVPPMVGAVFRHRGGEAGARAAAYRALWSVDPEVPPAYPVMSYAALLEYIPRFARTMINIFAACTIFAILLAMVGIYGLCSNEVIRRTHEIGLRRAIGASDGHVVALFLARGGRQLAIGLAVSVLASAGLLVMIARVGGLGPLALTAMGIAVAMTVSATVMTAIYIASRRAVRHEPVAALRYG